MKLQKTETESELKVERLHIQKHYSLTLDRILCKGCGICKVVCPKDAMEIVKISRSSAGEKARRPLIEVNEKKCVFCGICDAICPFGALTLKIDGEHVIPVIRTESFPQIIHNLEIDTTKCEVGCSDCEKACPLGIIKARKMSPLERAREIVRSKKDNVKLKPLIDVQLKLCPGCGLCELACPQKAISVKKIFHGSIKVNHEKCLKGCQDCLDVCPFPGVLSLSDDNEVCVNALHCTYCGICKLVCPAEGALMFQRTYINHSSVHSAAWNKALEKLGSTKVLAKELKAVSSLKTRKLVSRRFYSERPINSVESSYNLAKSVRKEKSDS